VSDALVRERRGSILVARLNRPEVRNALNAAVLTGLRDAVGEAEADPDVRALVLTGTGDRAFCTGEDLRAFVSGEMGSIDRDALDTLHRLMHGKVRVPVLGAANGMAVGGGLELLLGCDVIVASSQAKFGLPEVKRGLLPAGNGTFLGTRIPLAVALEMTLTGDSIDAARAYQLGLVNQVVPPDQVLDAALSFAERIAANGPLGVAATKELVHLAVTDFGRAQERLRELQVEVFTSEDAREGAMAFVEKRAPVWRGR
jgi:enoyl-CoA hydratase/carnithine racemase